MKNSIVLGAKNEVVLKQLRMLFIENGYEVVAACTDGYDVLRKCHTFYPSICILDFDMKGINGHEVSEIIINDGIAPVVVIGNENNESFFTNLSLDCNFTLMKKPLNRSILLNTVNLMTKFYTEVKLLRDKVSNMERLFREEKIINRAKMTLMASENIDEASAHKLFLKQSMDKGMSKYHLAQEILENRSEIF